jgi:hypothetical protein
MAKVKSGSRTAYVVHDRAARVGTLFLLTFRSLCRSSTTSFMLVGHGCRYVSLNLASLESTLEVGSVDRNSN